MLITYTKLSFNQKSTYYYILCYFPIQFCVSLCIGCTGKRSGISVKGLRKFPLSEGLSSLCVSERSRNRPLRPANSFVDKKHLPLIQESKLSVTGGRIDRILNNGKLSPEGLPRNECVT